jgi:hypothetical protein
LRLVEWPRSPLESRLRAACPRDGHGWPSAHSCCLPRCCWRCGRESSGGIQKTLDSQEPAASLNGHGSSMCSMLRLSSSVRGRSRRKSVASPEYCHPVTDSPQSYRSKANRRTRAMRRRSPCCIGECRRTPASSSGIRRVYWFEACIQS